MTLIVTLLTFFITNSTYAYLDCQKRPGIVIDIKNDKNGSLYRSKTQDQDGMGTCVSNSTSLMLEAHLGTPVSYHELAINYKLSSVSENFQSVSKVGDKSYFFTEGATSQCDVFKAQKNKGTICPRRFVAIEQLMSSNSNVQESYFKQLGKFYDQYQRLSSTERNYIRRAMEEARRTSVMSNFTECHYSNKLKESAKEAVLKSIEYLYLSKLIDIKESNMTASNQKKILNKIGTFEIDNNSKVVFKMSKQSIERMNFILNNLGPQQLNSPEKKEAFISNFFQSILGKGFNYLDFINENNRDSFVSIFVEKYLPKILSYSNPEVCKALRKVVIYDNFMSNMCLINPDTNNIFKNMYTVSTNFFGDPDFIESILDAIGDESSLEEFYNSILGKRCKNESINIPENLTCQTVRFPLIDQSKPMLKSIFQSEKDRIKEEKERTKRYLNGRVSRELVSKLPNGKIGNPIGITVCTKFFKEENNNFDMNWGIPKFSSSDCANSGRHGLHSVSIIGIRCKNGKIEYKIQNSWGKKFGAVTNSSFEKNYNEGSFWVPEDQLINNTTNINFFRITKE